MIPQDLELLAQEYGGKPYHGRNIFRWVVEKGLHSFDEMSDIPSELRDRLSQALDVRLPKIIRDQPSKDGRVRKLLLGLADGENVETVVLRHPRRLTLCISTQVGCALACTFCATGLMGLKRNLSSGEILGQILTALHSLREPLTHLVFMGMGEPLMNWENLERTLIALRASESLGLTGRRITISTAGYLPGMEKLLEADPPIVMAISLHAPNDTLRSQLVPLNKKYPIKMLLDWCHRYTQKSKRRKVTFEYVLLKDTNDSIEHASELAQLLKNMRCKVNLIPFNSIPGGPYGQSSHESTEAFQTKLLDSGIRTTLRQTLGQDIDAACGQLLVSEKLKPRPALL